jgi:hypothetical protein
MHPLFKKADELSHLAIGAATEVQVDYQLSRNEAGGRRRADDSARSKPGGVKGLNRPVTSAGRASLQGASVPLQYQEGSASSAHLFASGRKQKDPRFSSDYFNDSKLIQHNAG